MGDPKTAIGSLARITDFAERMPEHVEVPRERWRRGDYLVTEILPGSPEGYEVETVDGSYVTAGPGDRLIGALGTRAATLEVVGSWEAIGEDLEMQSLTAAGVLGVCTSASAAAPPLPNVRYLGHATHGEGPLNMADFVPEVEHHDFDCPVILIIGTSMNSGKTVAAAAMIRELTAMGKSVAGIKVTGVGRYRDTIAMKNAGAAKIADFVDVGLPSSVVPVEEYASSLRDLLSMVAAEEPDVVVIEAGASPLEPYRGDVAMEVLEGSVALTVLCASDPYAVMGVMSAFEMRPDLVTGPCTSTEAGVELIDKLAGVPAVNMFDESNAPKVAEFLKEKIS